MTTNEFLVFATGGGANVTDQATYAGLSTTSGGYLAGLARSPYLNKTWRQGAFIASMIAEFMRVQAGVDVLDDGDRAGKLVIFQNALTAFITTAGYAKLLPGADQTFDWEHNGGSNTYFENANVGAAAYVNVGLANSTGILAGFTLYGGNYTTAGTNRANGTQIAAAGAGGLTLQTNAAQPIYLCYNSAEAWRIPGQGQLTANGYSGSGAMSNGQVFLAGDGTNGAALQGRGATYDVALREHGGTVVLGVTTANQNIVLNGSVEVLFTGASLSGVPGAFWGNATNGFVFTGDGGTYDYQWTNASGSVVAVVPHNTTIFRVTGAAQANAGNIVIGGSSYITNPGNGVMQIVNSGTSGALYGGQGSTYDVSIVNKGGASAIQIPTGTVNVVVGGNISAASGIGITANFVSGQQTLTFGSSTAVAHGLGVAPRLVQLTLHCTSAEGGWSAGDELIASDLVNVGTPNSWGFVTWVNSTNVNVIVGNGGVEVMTKGGGNLVNITAANWTFIVKAFY